MTDAPPPYPGINGYHGYANGSAPPGSGAFGGAAGGLSSEHEKNSEAMASAPVQTGYYNPNQPGTVFIPPRPVFVLFTFFAFCVNLIIFL